MKKEHDLMTAAKEAVEHRKGKLELPTRSVPPGEMNDKLADRSDRQTQAAEDALNRARKRCYTDEHIARYLASPQYTGWTTFVAIIEQLQREKQTAIAASDAKYVPMLVEALKKIMEFGKKDVSMREEHYTWIVYEALSQLPEDLR